MRTVTGNPHRRLICLLLLFIGTGDRNRFGSLARVGAYEYVYRSICGRAYYNI